MIDCVVAPVFHAYVYGAVPLDAVAVNVPEIALQTATEFIVTDNAAFTVSVPEPVAEQPFESVTVTL